MKVMRLALCLLVLAAAAAGTAFADGPAIGAAAPTFQLTGIDGKSFSLADATKANKAVVLVFIATKCPYSNAYNDRMKQMADDFAKKGVLFVGINSNNTEPVEEVKSHAKEHGFGFTILKDPGNKVADLYDAKRTPEAFIVDKDGKVRYHGRIDENYEDASKVTSPDLKNAVDALTAGHAVAKAETKAFGCTIKRA
ncbi:MAG: thioredoxin family protein [Thermoanaerobaculia bacterium]